MRTHSRLPSSSLLAGDDQDGEEMVRLDMLGSQEIIQESPQRFTVSMSDPLNRADLVERDPD
jgi:hypothetical protein